MATMKFLRTRGFTLMEMLVTLATVGVLMAVAVPNMRNFVRNNRLTSAANDLLRSASLARSEAIKRQQGNVVLCASANPGNAGAAICSYGAFSGWIVFVDANSNWQRDGGEALIEGHEAVPSGVTVRSDNDGIVSFNVTGFANPAAARSPTANVVICDVRGNTAIGTNSTARAVLITQTGRARVSNVYADVTAASGAVPGTCL